MQEAFEEGYLEIWFLRGRVREICDFFIFYTWDSADGLYTIHVSITLFKIEDDKIEFAKNLKMLLIYSLQLSRLDFTIATKSSIERVI